MNLPQLVHMNTKGNITYTYDGGGAKLQKTVVDSLGSKKTVTTYIGGFVYQNTSTLAGNGTDTLQFIAHEEGRARWAYHKYTTGTTAYKYEYDFFEKDHLGNTRMVLTQQADTSNYLASMEAAYRTNEKQLFGNINYIKRKNLLMIETEYEKVDELEIIENFYFKILSSTFLHKKIKMITLQPQKYSLGYDFKPNYQFKVRDINILISEIDCNDKLLKDISCSEEFKRGLLVLVANGDIPIKRFAEELVKVQFNTDKLETKEVAIACDPDGETLFLFNTSLTLEYIKTLELSLIG